MANVAFVVGLAVLFIWVIRQLLIAYFSPLAAVPSAHFTAPVSSFWITLTRSRGQESRRRYEAHQRFGPIIRLGPTELGVNCIDDGVKSIYDGNFDKAPRSATLSNYGLPFMLTIMSSKKHSERRRMYSHVYSKTTVENASQLRAISEKIIVKQLHPLLKSWSKGNHAVEILKQTGAFGGDFVSAYIFGAECGTCLFENPDDKVKTINCFSGILEGFFWLTEIPAITVWLHCCGIHFIPESTFHSQERLEDMCLDLCKSAEAYNKPAAEDLTVYAQLRTNLASTGLTGELLEKTVAAKLLDHIIATVHGIGTTLTYAMTQLSKNPSPQTRLRDELIASRDGQPSPIQSIPKHNLPVLDAVLQETMRAHPVSLGPTFRLTPAKATRIGPYTNIPPHTTVSACAYTLHRGPAFPEPEKWRPERWLGCNEHELKEMKRWFWAFGSGPRGYIGDTISLYAMKQFLTAVYLEYETSIAKTSHMEQTDGLIGLPKDEEVWLAFRKVGTS